jgi:hypothetical protein
MSRNDEKFDKITSKQEDINDKLDGPGLVDQLLDHLRTDKKNWVKREAVTIKAKRAKRTKTQNIYQNACTLGLLLMSLVVSIYGKSFAGSILLIAALIVNHY